MYLKYHKRNIRYVQGFMMKNWNQSAGELTVFDRKKFANRGYLILSTLLLLV